MRIAVDVDNLLYRFVEQQERPTQEEAEALVSLVSRYSDVLGEVSLIVVALAVYGEDMSLTAIVTRAREINEKLGEILMFCPPELEARLSAADTASGGTP